MGKKQTALVTDVQQSEVLCHACIAQIKTACENIVKLNSKIQGEKDFTAQKKLILDKNTPLGELLKGKAKLTAPLLTYSQSIVKLEKFIAEKSNRWIGKSTLKDGKTHLANAKTVLKDYQDMVEASKLI